MNLSTKFICPGLICAALLSPYLAMADPTVPIPETSPVKAEILRARSGLANTFAKLRAGQPVTIAYLGGSITAGAGASTPANSYRARVTAWFSENFPPSKITEVDAAIGGTGSDLGVFRVGQDVLLHKPDLVFVEFAVNDTGAPPARILQGMEGIFRQTWRANPDTDLCLVYTYQEGQQASLEGGVFPPAASAHDFLAEKYGVPAINVAMPIAELVRAGRMLAKPRTDEQGKPLPVAAGVQLFSNDGVHPKDVAMEIYAKTITDAMPALEKAGKVGPHFLPVPVVASNQENAKLVAVRPAMLSAGWKTMDPNQGMGREFNKFFPQIWQANGAGESLSFTFKGKTARLFDIVGPDEGQVWITVDGIRSPAPIPRFDKYSTYPRMQTLTLSENLTEAVHTVRVEIDATQPDRTPALAEEKDKDKVDPMKYNGTYFRVGWIMLDGDIVG